jgi:hypothetical protein
MRLGNGTVPIMEYANGYPFLVERRTGSGLLLIFTSAPAERWSDFAFKGLFAPLIHRCIAYLTQSRDNRQESQAIGQELVASLRAPAAALEMELPDGDRRKAPVEVVGQNYQARFFEVDQPGHYRLWRAGTDSPSREVDLLSVWAVNFNPQELKQPLLADRILETASGAASFTFLSSDVDILAAVRQARYGSELWPYFLIAAIIAMIVEMWLSRSTPQPEMSIGRPPSQEAASVKTLVSKE